MSKWIRPKYYEQCKNNASSARETTLIDSRKISDDFWSDVFSEKCPNGLGETCEKIENDEDILSCDLNDDIDLLNNTNTIQDGDEQKTKSPADLSADEETTSRDIANIDDSGSKQAFDNNDPGYKTPLVHKYKRNSSAHSESATPCLFSPDLLSQETQDVDSTPRTHHLHDNGPTDVNKQPDSQSFLEDLPRSLEKEGLHNIVDSQDILGQMIADKRPRSSLAFLSINNSDESIDGWSDAMATPPMHWSPTSPQGCSEGEDDINQEKNVARTLFKETCKDLSKGMSGFSMLDCCEEQPSEVYDENNKTLQSSIKDESLMKAVMDTNNSSDTHIVTNNKSTDPKERSFKDSPSIIDAGDSSSHSTPTVFPPVFTCTSPVARDTVPLLELVQSTPKELHIHHGNSVNKDQNDRSRVKVKRNTSKSNLHRKASKSSPLFTKITAGEMSNQSNNFKDLVTSDDTLANVSSQSEALKMYDENSIGSDGKDVSGVSFRTLSKSLEEAMVKETEIASDLNTAVCLEYEKEKQSPEFNHHEETSEDQLLPSNDTHTTYPEKETTDTHTSDKIDIHLGEVFNKVGTTNLVTSIKRKSTSPLLSVKRSSKIKRFSYPTSVSLSSKPLTNTSTVNVASSTLVNMNNEMDKTNANSSSANNCYSISDIEQDSRETKSPQLPLKNVENDDINEQRNDKSNSKLALELPKQYVGLPDAEERKHRFEAVKPLDSKPKNGESFQDDNDSEKELTEDVTDCTLLGITENTPKMSSNDQLFDMDALSQFPYDMISHTPTSDSESVNNTREQTNPVHVNGPDSRDSKTNSKEDSKMILTNASNTLSGFKTASGKEINVSVEALKKAKAMFELENPEANSSVDDFEQWSTSGFKPTSGKDMNVSEEALKKAKAMFEMEDPETSFITKSMKQYETSGFKTASGKDINVSEKALNKAKAMFAMENQDTSFDCAKQSLNSGFKTANEKDITNSEEALKKAKAMFKHENQESVSKHSGFITASGKNNQEHSVVSMTPEQLLTSGFKTASGKEVNFSEEALKKAKAMFAVDNQEHSVVSKKSEQSLTSGFKTASGKEVNISEDALKKAKAMFAVQNHATEQLGMSGFKTSSGKDMNISEDVLKRAKAMFAVDNHEHSVVSKKSEQSLTSGFKTASGKEVNISEDALKKAKAMFAVQNEATEQLRMSGFKTASDKEVSISEEAMKTAKVMFAMQNQATEQLGMSGFKTASGKDVNISEEALKKAKATFAMDNQEHVSTKSEQLLTSGFKTASGKEVNISEEAMKKAKSMFAVDNQEHSVVSTKSEQSLTSGFKTASGKEVNISEEAIKKAKAMFAMQNQATEQLGMSGFKTASGKDVNISEEALKKAKVMFAMDNQEHVVSKKSEQLLTSGFKTARGKEINISEEALNKAKVLFAKENERNSIDPKGTQRPLISGFKTARGQNVTISEEALIKAKALVDEANISAKNVTHSTSRLKSASDQDVTISEEALKKTKAMFEMECNKNLHEYSNLSSKSNQAEKAANENSAYRLQCSDGNSVAQAKTSESQDQQVPSHLNTAPSSTRTPTEISALSSFSKDRLSLSSITCTADDHLTREILESSAALLADESFADLTDCLDIVPREHIVSVTSEAACYRVPRSPYSSSPQQSKRDAMMSNARQRYKSFLNDDDEIKSSPSLVARSSLKPLQASPTTVMHDRRSNVSLTPAVVGPKTSTPLSRMSSSRRENKFLTRQTSPLQPRVSSPSPPSPLANNKQSEPPTADTPVGGSSKKQFTTPFRSTSSSTGTTRITGTARTDRGKDARDKSPDRKRPRLNDSARNKTSKTESVKPLMGYLYSASQSTKRPSMREYVGNTLPQRHTVQQLQDLGVHDDVIAVTCSNAKSFRFFGARFFSKDTLLTGQGVRMEDGGLLNVGEDGRIGLQEIESALLSTPGVDSKLIPDGWISNHYRWIVWKLACMEVSFPQHFAAKSLTPERLLYQLKYRYDREIDRSHRSALKKILERDDVSSRTMVLCVSGIDVSTTKPDSKDKEHDDGKNNQNSICEGCVIEVTDGWYSINSTLDVPLANLLSKGKICVGMKLCINGAELIGSDQAVSPLEAPSSLMLRISANSTRRARWDSRLGFQRYSHPFPLPLSSLYPNGGSICCIDVVVLRRYPIEYMEKMANGTTAFRNSRAEERESKKFANTLERSREVVLARVQKEFEANTEKPPKSSKKPRRSYSPQDIIKLRGGKELYEVYMAANDPGFIEECLDNKQRKSLEEYRRIIQDNKQAELAKMFQKAWDEDEKNVSKRTVVPMLKVRIVNYLNCDNDKSEAVISVWRPTEDVVQLLSEGRRLRIYHVMASGSRYRQGLPSLQLSSTRSTRYKVMESDQTVMEDLFNSRKTTGFNELQVGDFALYSEVDLVGCVVSVSSYNNSSLQTVYLTDDENNLVAVKFWGGLKVYAVDDLVKPKAMVACTNLVVRSHEHINCPALAFNELSTLTMKPRETYLRSALEHLNHNIQNTNELMSSAQRLLDQIRRRPAPSVKMSNNSMRDSTTQGIVQPLADTAKTITSNNIPDEICNSSTSTKSGQCKRKLLESAPQPPVTPSIYISSSHSVRRDFKRPRRLDTESPH